MSGAVVRPAVPDDAEGIARVHTRSWQVAYRGVVPDAHLDGLSWQRRSEGWSQELAEPTLPRSSVLVAVDEGVVVGFASVGSTRDDDLRSEGLFELYAIYVSPDKWGRGVGSSLLDAALQMVPAVAPGLTLWVLADNATGRRFYERHGFAGDGTTRLEQFGGRELLELRYRLALGGGSAGSHGG